MSRQLVLVTHKIVRGDGQGRVNFEIARHCLASGWRVELLASEVDPALLENGATWTRIQPRLNRPDLARIWKFARLADRALTAVARPNRLIVANGFVLRVRHGVNVSHFVHSAWRKADSLTPPQGNNASTAAFWYRWYQRLHARCNCSWERQSYGAADLIVAVSQTIRAELIDIGVPEKRIRVVPNGVDLHDFRPGEADRLALEVPQNVQLALFVGDLRTMRKNLDTVLRAMVLIPKLHLAVVGSVRRSPYPAMAAALGVAGRVHFLDYRDDVADLMRSSDLLLFPSRYEPFGLVLLEALASGLPVITARNVGASGIVTPECGEVLDDPNDHDALAAATLRLLDRIKSEPGRQAVRTAARAAAVPYGWERVTSSYLRLFDEIVAGTERNVA